MTAAEGERERMRHQIANLRALIMSLESTIQGQIPATETALAVVDSAARLATTAARCDAYVRAEDPRGGG